MASPYRGESRQTHRNMPPIAEASSKPSARSVNSETCGWRRQRSTQATQPTIQTRYSGALWAMIFRNENKSSEEVDIIGSQYRSIEGEAVVIACSSKRECSKRS